ncbi:TolC family protein [Caenimonas koreensis DSM 17982]|uniref:TolC family protein n=1 Tax=Caenimonas koreensis DSM 17982 TaxID=1121255 RepID=A0A844AYG0_9BURK|nr:TolC family protein [Caenimonas koreensis]MRD49590.1 TolC family protein [Caenimonas koreensis DSM 17982]
MKRWIFAASAALAGALLAPAHGAQASGAPLSAALAPQAAPADLPSNDKAKALIDGDPRVVQARHALEAARHRADMLAAGPHEWTARASTQRRRYRSGAQDVNEWSIGLERAVRIGGKAALDRQLGETQLRLAEARLGEARHEAARELLDLWLNWLAADRTRQLWSEQLGFAQTSLNAAGTRRRAGDASMLEQNAARADLAEVQRQLSGAANEEAKARAKLRARFAPFPVSGQVAALGEPVALTPDDALWRERILAESRDLRIAKEELQQAELTAARASADRLADPTVGVLATSEAGGAERIVGLTLSIPLGGTYRNAQSREALAQVDVARAAVERALRELESEIAEGLTDARGSLERWKFAEQARAATQENAQLTQRAYTLGEADLQAVLLARRQLVDAALGSTQARVDALRTRYRLLIDAHLIWGLQDD